MAKFSEVVVVYDILPEVAAKMEDVLSEIVRKAAFDIQGTAQAIIKANGQVDTGFMVNSVYVVTSDQSTYGQVQSPTKRGQELLPEVERPGKPTEAIIAVGANYGIYQNNGTVDMPARPFLDPAVELVRPEFMRALTELEGKLAESVVIPGGGEG